MLNNKIYIKHKIYLCWNFLKEIEGFSCKRKEEKRKRTENRVIKTPEFERFPWQLERRIDDHGLFQQHMHL